MTNSDTMQVRRDDWSQPLFGERVPSADLDRCLNLVHQEAHCTRCGDACPVDAIGMESTAPVLDSSACVGCGACIAACPTDVYGPGDRMEQRLVLSVTTVDPADVAVVCAHRDEPGDAPVAEVAVVTHSRCLASLDVGHLIALSSAGTRSVTLDDTLCADCPIGAVHPLILHAVDGANALLGGDVIDVASARVSRSVDHEIIDGANPLLSRRGIFDVFARRVAEATHAPPKGNRPLSRDRLTAQLLEVGSLESVRVPMAAVRVDVESCTACGSCARFCPTDALVIEEDDGSFDLSFVPIECLDCGICAVACPEDAISFGDRIASPMERSSLAAGPLVECEACTTPTADRGGDGRILCTWCRRGAGAVRPLHDEAGLFDDLLSRIERNGDVSPPADTTGSDRDRTLKNHQTKGKARSWDS